MARCGGCSTLIFGPSYSCLECSFNSVDHKFTLCRDCYATGKVRHEHPLTSTAAAADLLRHRALLTRFRDLISAHPSVSPPKNDLKNLWNAAKSQIGPASPAMEFMAENCFESMGCNNNLNIAKFSSTLTKQHEAFLTPTPDSDHTTNYMKNVLAMKFTQPDGSTTTTTTAAYAIHHTASSSSSVSPPEAYHSSGYRPSPQTSSNGTSPMVSVLSLFVSLATTTFQLVEMALTIANLSSMCTIM
ncbi:hypothetical protein AAHA92_30610 [Salvia divinorum]|uniref:ZZ-type domain-containing protein n=1 Tax=Salvia divinorum TaxID=28513 RepID=A0ABD1FRF5_SALDI